MNKFSIAVEKWLREQGAPVDAEQAPRPCRLASEPRPGRLRFLSSDNGIGCEASDQSAAPNQQEPWRSGLPALSLGGPARLSSLSSLAALVACAGVLTINSSAAAQAPDEGTGTEQAAPDDAAPAPPPADSPEAAPPPADSPEAAAPVDSPEAASPPPEEAAAPETAPPPPEEAAAPETAEDADLVVTGFRKSLASALNQKQRSTTQVDAIVADDIADFPDLNLAESLQRIPGVAITRERGEGAQITVRGLSGLYTRTRLNGMDTRVRTTLGSATLSVGSNTSRSFDFNMFASELFNSIVVHKTATAELGEGSLGAVVDLNTGHPFAYKKGFTFVANAQGNYNDLSQTVRPRLAGLVGYHDPGGVWGATASAAYSLVRNDEAVSDSVRWAKANFRSVGGNSCAPTPPVPPATTPTPTTDPGCLEVANAFHARIPRYAQSISTAERLGLTAGLQFRPIKQTEIRLDALYASYAQTTEFKTIEVLFRANEGGMDVLNYTLERHPARFGTSNNTLTALSVDNAWVRSETLLRDVETDFHQLTLAIDQEFTTNLSAHLLAGTSRSTGHIPRQTTLMYDDRDYNGYVYDYSRDTQLPRLAFGGPDVTEAANFTLTELRDQVHTTKNAFDTVDLKLKWDIIDALGFTVGANYKNMDFDTKEHQRDGSICAPAVAPSTTNPAGNPKPGIKLGDGTNIYDCDTNANGLHDDGVLGPQGRLEFTDLTEYRGDVGAGSNTRWASPSVEGWTDFLRYYEVPLKANEAVIRTVREQNLGAFVQADGEIELGSSGMRLMYNAGVLYVQTRQRSGGYKALEGGKTGFVEFDRPMYDDWLPSANAALWLTNDLVVRLAAARVLSRPQLGDLSPGGSVDSFIRRISFSNPLLEPIRALALDVSTEWYFADESLLSLALFFKKIDSFPLPDTVQGFYRDTGLPESLISPTSPASQDLEGSCGRDEGCWEITNLKNGPGATVKGLEVGFQAPFSAFYGALPPVIRGMGFTGNYTLVISETKYTLGTQLAPGLPVGATVEERLLGLSNHSFNATLYYEDSKFGARVSLAHRDDYLENGPNITGNLWQFVAANTRLDFSSSYSVIDELKITFEVLNLTDSTFYNQVDIDVQRPLEYKSSGRNFLLGARYSY